MWMITVLVTFQNTLFFSVFKHFGESIFVDIYLSSNNRRNV